MERKSSLPGVRSRLSQILRPRSKPRNSFPQSESERSVSMESKQEIPQGDSGIQSFVESMSVAVYDGSDVTINFSIHENAESQVTMTILRKCNQQVIRPFRSVLKVIAWKPLFNTITSQWPCLLSFFNILFSAVILTFLLTSYVYQVFLLPFYINEKNTTHATNRSNISKPFIEQFDTDSESKYAGHYQHLISVSLIPNFINFISYLIGFWHFRISDNERVEALLERVFLSFVGCDRGRINQRWIANTLRVLVAFCIIWTLLCLLSNILYDLQYLFENEKMKDVCPRRLCLFLLWLAELIGNGVGYVVITVIIFNFAVQCEAIIAFIDCLLQKIQERSLELREVIKEINCAKENVKILNGASAIVTSMTVFVFGDLSILGVAFFFKSENLEAAKPIEIAYRTLFILRTIPVALFPIIQTSRVNQYCNRIHHAGIEVRTYGYRNASQLELDSFLLYTTKNRFWARLFAVGFRGYHLTTAVIMLIATLAILVQVGVIDADIL